MSGHSHWANIKGKKELNDQQKGKLFSKVSREIILAITGNNGVTDPNSNIALRTALQKAREVNMPKDNIDRLIERVKARSESVREVLYEAVYKQGVTLLIKTATDNPNRTHSELSSFLEKNGIKLVSKGSVAYQYDLVGEFMLENLDENKALKFADQVKALDIEEKPNYYLVYVDLINYSSAIRLAQSFGINKAPSLIYKPKLTVTLESREAEKLIELLEKIEELDDVQEIFTNVAF